MLLLSLSGLSAEEISISICLGFNVFDLILFLLDLEGIIGENCRDYFLKLFIYYRLRLLDDCDLGDVEFDGSVCLSSNYCGSPPSYFSS